jgi:multidrug efflux pump subunit AcrA (membrane-fusion protein)
MATNVDLRELAVDRRGATSQGTTLKRRYPWLSRRVVPLGVVLGFAGLLAWAARDQFRSAKPVTVSPVIVQRGEVPATGAALFQAPGWVEPRPRPVFAAALTMGVVEEVFVVDGQDVHAGDPIARLIDVDAKIAVEQAKAAKALAEAELASARAEAQAAQTRLEQPVHLDAAVAEAESLLAEVDTQLSSLPFLIEGAQARVSFAQQDLEGKRNADSAIAERVRQRAQSDLEAAQADCHEMQDRLGRLKKQREALDRRREALARQRELLVDESRAAADATAKVKAAEARLAQAVLDLQAAELALSRTLVTAPISGRVLEVIAQPGTRLSGVAAAGETPMSASAVASLYDPKSLQVRADVRLDDVPSIAPGQRVTIETPAAKGALEGVFLSATSQANVGKNTLEVKVAINDPPATLRPEMLVTATFYAPKKELKAADAARQIERVLIPRALVEQGEQGASVWIAAAGDQARRKPIRLGGEAEGGLVEVIEGLSPGDWLIAGDRASLAEGQAIEIVREDDSLGKGE